MDVSAIYLSLALLALCVAFNLHLTVKLLAATRALSDARTRALPVGEPVHPSTGKALAGGAKTELIPEQGAVVLLFLSSKCPLCRQKLPEIASYLPLREEAGLSIRLVSSEPAWRVKRFLQGTGLAEVAVMLDKKRYLALNPAMASPHYLFIDADSHLQAAGMIGDADWQSFGAQMDELKAAA